MASVRRRVVWLLDKARDFWRTVRLEAAPIGEPIATCMCSYPDGNLAAHWNEWRLEPQEFEARFRTAALARLTAESAVAEVAWELELPVAAVVNILRQEVARELNHPSPLFVEEPADSPVEKSTDV